MKRFINKKTLLLAVTIIVIIHPILELDYLMTGFLDEIGLFRLTTLIDFVVLPLFVLLTFWFNDKNKKRTVIVFSIWAVLLVVYMFLHIKNAQSLIEVMNMPSGFDFTIKEEIFYTLTLLIPLAYVYVYDLSDIKEELFKKITIATSAVISLPIFISDLFVFGKSTYGGYTVNNFLSWFSLPYTDRGINVPKQYSCKFFFEEGNTTGIILLMLLPLLYYFFYKEKDKKKKILLGVLIAIQSLSMLMLSTRVATYGTILVPIVMLVVYIFLMILKTEKLDKVFLIFLLVLTVVNSVIVPYGPAYQNQLIDAENDFNLKISDGAFGGRKKKIKDELDKIDLMPYSEEWYNYYIYIFEDNAWLINATPKAYFMTYYYYKFDPKFWVDLIFDVDLEDRVNGRQIENIFQHYKWDPLNTYQKSFGMGYSTFMWGSIILERDFAQQIFSYGYIGFSLIMLPWIFIILYLAFKLIIGRKKGHWTFYNITLMFSICIGYGCSYVSGHTFDELSASMIIALLCGILLKELSNDKKQEKKLLED